MIVGAEKFIVERLTTLDDGMGGYTEQWEQVQTVYGDIVKYTEELGDEAGDKDFLIAKIVIRTRYFDFDPNSMRISWNGKIIKVVNKKDYAGRILELEGEVYER